MAVRQPPERPMSPRFSVIIPAYNHSAYIIQAMDSVLEQTYTDWELIVIDDASSDDTWATIKEHSLVSDPRCLSLRHESNRGAHATLNEGISLARGEWVAILNSDDYFLPKRLETALAVFSVEPNLAAAVSNYAYVDDTGKEITDAASLATAFPQVRQALGSAAETLSGKECEVLALLTRNYWHSTSNLICKRDVLISLGGFSDWRYVHDHDLFLRLAAAYPVKHIPEHLLNYRFHSSNTLSESAVRSVGETAAMLASFIARKPLPSLNQPGPNTLSVLNYIYSNCRLYGGERLAFLFQALPAEKIQPLWRQWQAEPEAFAILAKLLQQEVQLDRVAQDQLWQKEQTNRWWARAKMAERCLNEVEQSLDKEREEGRRHLQQYSEELAQARENERWQRSQTDKWWQRTVELQSDLDRYRNIYARVRWLGVPYVWQRFIAKRDKPEA